MHIKKNLLRLCIRGLWYKNEIIYNIKSIKEFVLMQMTDVKQK